jgi:SAM-dependent methyltransferase
VADRTLARVWDDLAKDDPIKFTFFDAGHDAAAYDKSGEDLIDDLLGRYGPLLPSRRGALDIGSGMGRLTIPMARSFDEVTAIDLSTEFLHRLEERCASLGVDNIQCLPVTGPWAGDDRYDLVVSMLVFQHIIVWDEVETYFREVHRSLRPGGVFAVQFDTRPPDWKSRVRRFVPDAVLPKLARAGCRRTRRKAQDVRTALQAAGLAVIDEMGRDTPVHIFVARRAPLG